MKEEEEESHRFYHLVYGIIRDLEVVESLVLEIL